ncbi:outer membrane protein assembly factor BamE (lipoprotein component of BamABCDE complex) [Paraburkholderia sp. HC6.4b]|uniref:hypothetical protein n=1 Tax=unclassified Paraburkholderia TaxID=2615204 RepID=UPI001609B182|nr:MULTISPECIES: hypothetical protein [unclassified Paraburkholderia]MBB5409370.1 outer membrane protein assembly factor BamE (lipoprotein component of BamABCDE complex) [Paraburkholderia sp. HC6.4b]MBB5451099.1 outer membrane protein assembly factor BamE (lipoprotein component of BamABCDE complex) [Paraburkholderia sp. Kb1A]
MKTLAALAVVSACMSGLAGCAPTQTYDQIHVRGWTREGLERRFPTGTSQRQVLEKLGSPYSQSAADGLIRWDYVGGASGHSHVVFLFRNGALVQKQFDNF